MDTSKWPLLMKNIDKLVVREGHWTPINQGCDPLKRSITDLLKQGYINLDKPSNPSSHEVVSWVKRILKINKTGHSGTLDPKVTGVLIICLESATRLAKSQQNAGKEQIAIMKLNNPLKCDDPLKEVCKKVKFLQGAIFQRPPLISAVNKELRIRHIQDSKVIEWNAEENMGVIWVSVEAGTQVRTLCEHLGLMLGTGGFMQELRRNRTGQITEQDNMYSMFDVMDAKQVLDNFGDESQMRKVVHPMEGLLLGYKRILIKDSAINAICYGAKLMLAGVLRFDSEINVGEVVVIMSTKGEAVALGLAEMTSAVMATCDHGMCARLKRVILDRDQYPRKWGHGPRAKLKKQLKEEGKLDKFGRPNENTPQGWNPSKNLVEGSDNKHSEKEQKVEKEEKKKDESLKRKKSDDKKEKKKKKKKKDNKSDDDVSME